MQRWMIAAAAVLCLAGTAPGAMAQRRGRASADEDTLPPSKPPPIPTLPPSRGISGPRLDPGAVVCQSESDLQRRAEVNRRRLDGVPDAGNPLENCRMMTQPQGVEVVARHGMGRTEVKLRGSAETGWTDSYLPAS
jgi:hypothetical protein